MWGIVLFLCNTCEITTSERMVYFFLISSGMVVLVDSRRLDVLDLSSLTGPAWLLVAAPEPA